jgi:hypothetical protein
LGGAGIFFAIVGIAITIGLVILLRAIKEEFTAPRASATPAKEEITEKETEIQKVIEGLSYIKIMASGYSDDADPEDDGLAIDISYYDNKSERIKFRNTPITVRIKLYGYRNVRDTFDHDKMELIYEGSVTIDHSMKMGEMFGKYIRVPFEDIAADKDKYYKSGTVEVVVKTERGDFSDIEDLVSIYAAK